MAPRDGHVRGIQRAQVRCAGRGYGGSYLRTTPSGCPAAVLPTRASPRREAPASPRLAMGAQTDSTPRRSGPMVCRRHPLRGAAGGRAGLANVPAILDAVEQLLVASLPKSLFPAEALGQCYTPSPELEE